MQIKWFRCTGTKTAVEIALMLNSMRRQDGKQSCWSFSSINIVMRGTKVEKVLGNK